MQRLKAAWWVYIVLLELLHVPPHGRRVPRVYCEAFTGIREHKASLFFFFLIREQVECPESQVGTEMGDASPVSPVTLQVQRVIVS